MSPPFHPLVARWLAGRFAAPTPPQAAGWAEIARGRDVLIAAPTGSGKTLAAFLWAINGLVEAATRGALREETAVVYVSPLRALSNDIERNLHDPLAGIRALAAGDGLALPELRVAVRTGDTPGPQRARMGRRPPHILITTPESLYILLTAERSRQWLRTARVVIVDELHAVAGDKRGAHLALSLERLDLLAGTRLQRIGLSATQRPIEEIARWLVGTARLHPDGTPDCAVVDMGHQRTWQLSIEVPQQPLGAIATHDHWAEVYDRVAALATAHRTTLVFVHTRRLAERVAHQLTQRLGPGRVATHHGSLARHVRLDAEQRLKTGQVPVVVATASLELGIDIGDVDLVCHLGAPRSLAQLVQRVGRSGHGIDAVPRGVLFPLTRDDLLQSAAAVYAVRAGQLDRTVLPDAPLDVLAQQIVATVAAQEISEEALWTMVRRAYPYRGLSRATFEQVVAMLADGIAARQGRTGAYLHRDRVHGMLRPRRGARLAAITSGGAIPETADYDVVEEPTGVTVGKVNEDFAVESQAGDIFLLGNQSWQIRRVEAGTVRVTNAHGAPPSIPFWLGEAPGRTPELSAAVSALRERLTAGLADRDATIAWLVEETGVDRWGAEQLVTYAADTVAVLGVMPSQRTVVAERFFDEAGGMQLVLHAPFGSRITRAWGLALRKRFCLTFDFELQAAATDDGIVLSLGEQHAFPLESVFAFVRTATVEADLVQALLASPLFTTRWRQNATRALAVLRYRGGRRVPMPIQRMRAEDLLAAVFPAQVACQDNHAGPITPPDHPLVTETIRNGLHEAMDLDGLRAVIGALERGEIRTVAVETPAPSPASHEILHANPYAFLDDAPLEERRARAVRVRRLAPDLAAGMGALDDAAIARVRAEAWPPVRDPEELHDLLLTVGLLPVDDAPAWTPFAQALAEAGRATLVTWDDERGRAHRAWVATERLALVRTVYPDATCAPEVSGAAGGTPAPDGLAAALAALVHGWLQVIGPTTAAALADRLGLPVRGVEQALLALEAQGVALRGRFTSGAEELEWCERRLLARIHRLTLGRLRAEIDPVPAAEFMRFLFRWQHAHPGTQLHGRDGLLAVIGQLQGLELPAPAWEATVLPLRVRAYDPADLDALCLAGTVTWGRLSGGAESPPADAHAAPRRGRPPRPLRTAPLSFVLRDDLPALLDPHRTARTQADLSPAAQEVVAHLAAHGASFFPEIVRAVQRSPTEVEDALWELVRHGWVSGDGMAGLRRLLRGPSPHRWRPTYVGGRGSGWNRAGGHPEGALAGPAADRSWTGWSLRMHARSLPTGRWALWPGGGERTPAGERAEAWARQLLRRWGIVLREVLAREHAAPPWRALLEVYRRWEAQGLVRGGRFVAGFVGEQFALPEAVEALRVVRRTPAAGEVVVVAAADPLNLMGVLLPGTRVAPTADVVIAFRDGAPLDVGPPGAVLRRLQPSLPPPPSARPEG